jgi:hypothetical protein
LKASDPVAQRGVCSTLDTKRRAEVRHLRTELNSSALRAYATVTAEAVSPLRESCVAFRKILLKSVQQRSTLKDVLTAVSFQECAASPPCGSTFVPLVVCLYRAHDWKRKYCASTGVWVMPSRSTHRHTISAPFTGKSSLTQTAPRRRRRIEVKWRWVRATIRRAAGRSDPACGKLPSTF